MLRRARRPLHLRYAYSLVEVMIAVGVLSVGLLGLMSAMMFGLRGAEHAQRVTEANNYARAIIEYIRIGNRANMTSASDATKVSLTDPPYSDQLGVGIGWGYFPKDAGDRYLRQVTCTRILPSGGPAPYGQPNLYEIRVRIFWQNASSEFASGTEKKIELVGYHKS